MTVGLVDDLYKDLHPVNTGALAKMNDVYLLTETFFSDSLLLPLLA